MNNILSNPRVKMFLHKHTSTILACIGSAGMVVTTILAVRATPKVMKLLENEEKEQGTSLTKADIFVIAAPSYIPSVIVGISSIVCVFGANILNKKQSQSLASAYILLENSYKKYRGKVIERYGAEVDKEIRQDIAIHCSAYHQLHLDIPDNKVIWYDDFSGNSIVAYEREIIDAEYHINRNLVLGAIMTLNDYYEMFGFPKIPAGEELYFMMCDDYVFLDFYHDLINQDDGGDPIYMITTMFPPEPREYYEEIGLM